MENFIDFVVITSYVSLLYRADVSVTSDSDKACLS